MIVFQKDWALYPNAIPDTKTRNKSFLKMAKVLKDMGVKNYFFHLALLQPELQGVDPHDEENLSIEQKAKILYEVDNNPWYFLREIVLIKGAGYTTEEKMYVANRANIAAMWLLLACIDYIQIQPRQTGKSFGTDCNSLWLLYFCYRDTQMNLITKDDTTRASNIRRLKDIRDEFPSYLSRHSKFDDNNQISLSCKALNNKFVSHVAQSSAKGAQNLGRGLTSPYVDIDEGPFITHVELTISSAMGSMNTARELAARMGKPYCTIFTTTAGNPADRDGKFMYDIWNNAAPWSEMFLDCTDRKSLIDMISANKHGLDVTVNLTMSALQVGKTKEWLLDAVSRARGSADNIDRDYFNRWTSGNDEGLVTGKKAAEVRESEMDPVKSDIFENNFILKWYEEYSEDEHYVIGVDTSDAIGRDDIAVILTNVRTGATAASGFYNEINLSLFAKWLKDLLLRYKNTTLIPERQYNAQVMIDYLILKLSAAGEDPFVRIYNKVVQERDSNPDLYNQIMGPGLRRDPYYYDKYKDSFGFKTNAELRKLLYGSVMFNTLEHFADKVRDQKLISQMLSLVVRNNRVDHAVGSHDDMVIAWLLGHWMLNHGLNLQTYNINTRSVLSDKKVTVTKEAAEILEDHNQQRYKKRIDVISEELKQNRPIHEIIALESELRMLVARIKDTDDTMLTIDAMIENGRQGRRGASVNTTFKQRGIGALFNR